MKFEPKTQIPRAWNNRIDPGGLCKALDPNLPTRHGDRSYANSCHA